MNQQPAEAHEALSLGAALDIMRGLWQLNHALERLCWRALYAASTLEAAVDRLLESSHPKAVATTLKLLASLTERLEDEFEGHRGEPTR